MLSFSFISFISFISFNYVRITNANSFLHYDHKGTTDNKKNKNKKPINLVFRNLFVKHIQVYTSIASKQVVCAYAHTFACKHVLFTTKNTVQHKCHKEWYASRFSAFVQWRIRRMYYMYNARSCGSLNSRARVNERVQSLL